MIRLGILRAAADAMAQAAADAIEAYQKQRVTDEPHITDRFLGAAETRMKCKTDWDGRQLIWSAMTLRAGPKSAAHEKRHGADILGVFTAELRDYKVAKGFLAQAKRAEPGQSFPAREWKRLQGQCNKMLARTPDAFVVTYSKKDGMRFFSALAVTSYTGLDIFNLYGMAPRQFFERHFQSFIGDRCLHEPSIAALDRLISDGDDERSSRYVLNIRVYED